MGRDIENSQRTYRQHHQKPLELHHEDKKLRDVG